MKLWQYNGFDPVNKAWISGFVEKDPEVWDVISPGPDYVDITTDQLLFEREIKQKMKREVDGCMEIVKISAKMRIDRLTTFPIVDHQTYHDNVYTPLELVINNVCRGYWINAYEDFENIIPNTYLTAEKIIEFRIITSTYITTSGQYDEYTGLTIDIDGYILP